MASAKKAILYLSLTPEERAAVKRVAAQEHRTMKGWILARVERELERTQVDQRASDQRLTAK